MENFLPQLEIEIRGSTLKISAAIESSLMAIIYFSNKEQYHINTPEKLKALKLNTFAQKIDKAKKVLEHYHKDLFNSNTTLLNDIETFKEFRNRFAHCAIIWVDEKPDYLDVLDVVEDNNKKKLWTTIKYSRESVAETIAKAGKLILPTLHLHFEVEARLKRSSPDIYALLNTE